ncbi:N/A [soil metagenome]
MNTPKSQQRILLVDDEAEFTELLRMNLLRTGRFEVEVENDATNALAKAREFRPDIILLDIVMPGIDGGDVSSLLRDDPVLRSTPVIMVSALVSNDELNDDEVAQSGDKIILAKPVRMEKLLAAIDQATQGAF